jgi:DNA primase
MLLYGDKTEEFEDVLLKSNGEGEIEHVIEKGIKYFTESI